MFCNEIVMDTEFAVHKIPTEGGPTNNIIINGVLRMEQVLREMCVKRPRRTVACSVVLQSQIVLFSATEMFYLRSSICGFWTGWACTPR